MSLVVRHWKGKVHLEEVEALADRVSMMSEGCLQCIGPLALLKARVGRGVVEVHATSAAGSSTGPEALALLLRGALLRDAGATAVETREIRGNRCMLVASTASLPQIFSTLELLRAAVSNC